MIEIPEEFHMAIKATALFDGIDSEIVMLNKMYEYLNRNAENQDEWLRRGRVVISFLEDVVEGQHTDGELVNLWLSCRPWFHIFAPDIRTWFILMLEKMKEYQAQNEAGSFAFMDLEGNPWTPRQ